MKNYFKILSLVFVCFIGYNSKAQVTVNKPEGLDGLIYYRTEQRKNPDAKVLGYNILIFRGENRGSADKIKAQFDSEYSDYSEVVWDEPNFKVYVGLFKTKLECMHLFHQIKDKFPTAIPILQKILYPPLNY